MIFIMDGYAFGQSRRIKGMHLKQMFFPNILIKEGIERQWVLVWILHIYVAIILLDINTTHFLLNYALTPAYNAFLPMYKYIPIIDGLNEVYRADARTLDAPVISSVIVGCTVGTLLGGCFIARDIYKTFFNLSLIKKVSTSPGIPMMKKTSFLSLLWNTSALLVFLALLLFVLYFFLFSEYLFFKTAVSPEYMNEGSSGLKYVLIGWGVGSESYWFSYAWMLPTILLVLFPAILRVIAAKVYVTRKPRNS